MITCFVQLNLKLLFVLILLGLLSGKADTQPFKTFPTKSVAILLWTFLI